MFVPLLHLLVTRPLLALGAVGALTCALQAAAFARSPALAAASGALLAVALVELLRRAHAAAGRERAELERKLELSSARADAEAAQRALAQSAHDAMIRADLSRARRSAVEDTLSEGRYRALVRSAPIGIFETDEYGNCVFVNQRWTELTGVRFGRAMGQGWIDCLHPEDSSRVTEIWCNAARSGSEFNAEYRCQSGEHTRWVIGSAVALRDASGQLSGYIGTLVDITERQRQTEARAAIEAAVRASLAEKEVLLQEIHHRVKNNLQVISSLLSLQIRNVSDAQLRALLEENQLRIRSIALLHERLYQARDLANIDMRDYLRSLLSELLRAHGAAGRVRVSLDVDDLALNLDGALPCGLILNELVTNALKHAFPESLAQPELRVSLGRTGDALRLSVSDNGRGLSADVDDARAGTLGMRLVRALCKQLGGELTVDRSAGTSWSLIFPDPAGADTGNRAERAALDSRLGASPAQAVIH